MMDIYTLFAAREKDFQKQKKVFENFGAVGVDASIWEPNRSTNTKVLLPLMKEFIKNKCNIFIFPEGRLATKTELEFHSRFQPGVATMINKLLDIKKEIKVVPLAFAYGKKDKKELVSIQMGTPILFKRFDEKTSVTHGDIESNNESVLYKFFQKNMDKEDVVITNNGTPVNKKDVVGYLKTVLVENLKINSTIANNNIESGFLDSEVEEY